MFGSSPPTPLAQLVSPLPGPLAILGAVAVVDRWLEPIPEAVVVDGLTKPKRLIRRAGERTVVRADPDALPFAPASLWGLVALEVLGRSPDPRATLSHWAEALRPSGTLILLERQTGSSAATLRRLVAPTPRPLRPEDLTRLLLDLGLGDIRQAWPRAPGRRVITWGTYRGL